MYRSVSIGFYIICAFVLAVNISFSQDNSINKQNINDTILLGEYAQLQTDFIETYKDSAFYYGNKALALSKKLDQKYYEGFILCDLAYNYISIGDYTSALKHLIDATKLAEDNMLSTNIIQTPFIKSYLQKDAKTNRKELLGWIKNSLGILYGEAGNNDKDLKELLEAKELVENDVTDMFLLAGICSNIMSAYLGKNELDSALYYQRLTMSYENKTNRQTYNGVSLTTIGEIFSRQGRYDSAKKYLFDGIAAIEAQDKNLIGLGEAYISLSNLYYNTNRADSSIYYANKALRNFRLSGNDVPETLDAYTALALNYNKSKKYDSAYKYLDMAKNMRDSLNDVELNNLGKFHSMGFDEQLRLKELETAAIVTQNRNRIILLSIVIAVSLVVAFIFYRNNKQKQKANVLLLQQKEKMESTLLELKSTQAQLIQSEKMASLGELTAGIAHEIQNPLNFMNNFSEVNKEMLEELLSERSKVRSERNEQLENEILNDIKDNEEKINHHGKRADAIVKGMLQHSKTSTGKKEPTNINALCDEYLRLAYHGMRAKDKDFNAEIKTDFDESLNKINIVPQDIGRVLLNLLNNAFYAVNERNKQAAKDLTGSSSLSVQQAYVPTVIVVTKKTGTKAEISVSDNGNGVPQNIVDKIFQPFFTTKPTGQGTGLGLSLAYDIIKAHGGEIKLGSKEGGGSEFIIQLPNHSS